MDDVVDKKMIPEQMLLTPPLTHLGDHPGGHHDSTNKCQTNKSFIWCFPADYNQEKHPFTCEWHQSNVYTDELLFLDFHLVNKSLPWDYAFRFVIEEISNINDKAQTMSISMYFAVSWLEPRLQINVSATEWTEDRTGPLNVSLNTVGAFET